MKSRFPLFCSVACVLFGCSAFASLRAEETSVWLAGKARSTSGGMLLPDEKGIYDLELKDSTGVSIGAKPPLGGDTKSLEFSGSQVSAFRTKAAYPPVGGNLKVELEAMVPDGAPADDATLVRHGTQWEIRFLPKSSSYAFIVWHDKNVFSEVRVPMKLGEWEKISAGYTGDELTLQVGEATAKATPKDVLREESSPAPLLVGASTTKILDESMPRLFNGSLANIRISLE